MRNDRRTFRLTFFSFPSPSNFLSNLPIDAVEVLVIFKSLSMIPLRLSRCARVSAAIFCCGLSSFAEVAEASFAAARCWFLSCCCWFLSLEALRASLDAVTGSKLGSAIVAASQSFVGVHHRKVQ